MEDCIHPRRPKIFTRGPFRPHDMTLRVIKYFDSETTLISVRPSDVNSIAIASNLAQTSVYATLLSFNPREDNSIAIILHCTVIVAFISV